MPIPGYVNYSVPSADLTATANVAALTLPAAWTVDKGGVGLLSIEVLTAGETAFLRFVGDTGTTAPADPVISASEADGRVARCGPIPRSQVTAHEVYTSSATTQVRVKWLPIQWGG